MQNMYFSQTVSVFHERRLPEPASPVGYAALVDAYALTAPLPMTLCAIGEKHRLYSDDGWRIFTPRHTPEASLEGHLVFALKYEGLDLLILKRLFAAAKKDEIAAMVRTKPTSAYMRRIWFLYEWLLDDTLPIDEPAQGNYVDAVDTTLQYAAQNSAQDTSKRQNSPRHNVRNNMPGSRLFCPMVARTANLEAFIGSRLDEQAEHVISNISSSVLARTAAFLILKDSKSSYAIEGETPPHTRIQRWGKAIGQAGKYPLEANELLRLQRIVIGDDRFITMGFRVEGGFIGEHEIGSRLPLPDHISARHEDLDDLVAGLVDFDSRFAVNMDPVIAATVLAFGFVYIHPFADGNGRLHRYLIHQVLTARGFNPPGMVFPVSSAILERIDDYRRVLESYSTRLIPFIEWEPTEKMNVRVLNDTADFYRYFDATKHAEFLYECVQKTIITDLPTEAAFLVNYETFKTRVQNFIEMPDSTIDLLFNFIRQNEGRLSKRAREKEFSALTEIEAEYLESVYTDIFLE